MRQSFPPARLLAAVSLASAALLGAAGARQDATAPPSGPRGLTAREVELALSMSPLPPLPPSPGNLVADDPRAAELGRRLFFDPALSGNGELSCSTCHDPARDFSDGKPLAEGLAVGTRRTPSLWNVAWSRWLFWDGRAAALWQQALGPLESELEMGGDRLAVARHVARTPQLAREYEALFGPLPELADALPESEQALPARAKPMPDRPGDPRHVAWLAIPEEQRAALDRVLANVGKALEAYERRLVRVDAPFDRFVAGLRTGDAEKLAALSDEEVRGLSLFLGRARCRTCHAGPTFSDGEFHDLALPTPDGGLPRDPGRYDGLRRLAADPFSPAGEHADAGAEEASVLFRSLDASPERWGEFKTPSLRVLTASGPFMHAGQFASLAEVVRFYSTREGAAPAHGHRELVLEPLRLSEAELLDLVAFLRALQGRPADESWSAPPELEAGG